MPSLACYKFWTPSGDFQINLVEKFLLLLELNMDRKIDLNEIHWLYQLSYFERELIDWIRINNYDNDQYVLDIF